MLTKDRTQINDIIACLHLAKGLGRIRLEDHPQYKVFSQLAGDSAIDLLAYAIWRGRGDLLTWMRADTEICSVKPTSRASHAQHPVSTR